MNERDPMEAIDSAAPKGYEPPRFEVVSLACEINAYAPAGDDPLS